MHTWQKPTLTIADKLTRYKYNISTIFRRRIIVNSYIIPKIIYTATVLDPPQKILADINKHIRRYTFGNTIYSIQNKTRMQEKKQGGIAMQDIHTKSQSIRIHKVGQIIIHPEKHPLGVYTSEFVYTILRNYQHNTTL